MSPEQILQAVVGFFSFVFSIIVHENAHGLAAERYGDPTARLQGRITMNPLPHVDPVGSVILPILAYTTGIPFIGWAKPVPVATANLRNPVVHGAYVAAAGPASNFFLAAVSTVLYMLMLLAYANVSFLAESGGNSRLFFETLFISMIYINCLLALFNLIPVPPLDGHWILMMYLPDAQRTMLARIRPYGFFILLLLLWTGVIRFLVWGPLAFVAGNLLRLARSVV